MLPSSGLGGKTPKRGFQSVWFSLALIVPEGLTSCSFPGQPFSGLKDAGVSKTSEDDSACVRPVYACLPQTSFSEPGIFHMFHLRCSGALEESFLGGRLNISNCRQDLLILSVSLHSRRCAYNCVYAGKMQAWGSCQQWGRGQSKTDDPLGRPETLMANTC